MHNNFKKLLIITSIKYKENLNDILAELIHSKLISSFKEDMNDFDRS